MGTGVVELYSLNKKENKTEKQNKTKTGTELTPYSPQSNILICIRFFSHGSDKSSLWKEGFILSYS